MRKTREERFHGKKYEPGYGQDTNEGKPGNGCRMG
jgi:hypothetical protein